MSEHDFTINLKINRGQADASAKAAIAAARAIEQAHKQTADTEEKTQKRLLTDAEVAEKAKLKLIADTNRARIAAAIESTNAAQTAAKETEKAAVAATKASEKAAVAAAKAEEKARKEAAQESERIARQTAKAIEQANRQTAREAEKEARAAARATELAQRQSAKEAERLNAKSLTSAEIAEKAKQRLIEDTNRAKIQAATAALKADDDGAKSINRMNAAIAITQAGLKILGELAGAFGAGLESAANKADQLAGKFKDQRTRLAELASLEGRKLDNQYTVDFAQFQAKTGATADEALAFRTEFMNSGAQHIGTNISEAGAGKLKEQALQFALARGLDPKVVGDLSGNLLGFKNWEKQYGANAPKEVLGSMAKVIGGLQVGRGDAATLTKNATSLMAQTLNEDTLKGTFQRPEDVAALISLMAESKPDEAETMGRASIRALRAFGDSKMGPLLGEAGVTPQTGFRGSAEAVGKKLQDIATSEKVPVQDVIARYTSEEREKIALATIVNKGIGPGGVLAKRDEYMKQFTGESALKDIGEYRGSEEGASRSADAEINLANAQKGARTSGVDILHRQAMAELIREGQVDTTSSEVKKYISRAGGIGLLPDWDRQMVYRRTASILSRRAADAGLDDGMFGEAGVFGHLGKARLQWAGNKGDTETFRRGISEIQQAGGNPFGDFLPAMRENTKAVQEQNNLMKDQGAGGAPRPMARPNPNPANRVP